MKIKEAKYIDGYTLKLIFTDSKEQVVDFGPFLQKAIHPEIRKFLTLKRFKEFTLIGGELMWGEFDLIFPITDLYHNQLDHSQDKKQASASGSQEVTKTNNF